jgi:hypothetical protein
MAKKLQQGSPIVYFPKSLTGGGLLGGGGFDLLMVGDDFKLEFNTSVAPV